MVDFSVRFIAWSQNITHIFACADASGGREGTTEPAREDCGQRPDGIMARLAGRHVRKLRRALSMVRAGAWAFTYLVMLGLSLAIVHLDREVPVVNR